MMVLFFSVLCATTAGSLEEVDCDSELKLQQHFLYIAVRRCSVVTMTNCNVNVM